MKLLLRRRRFRLTDIRGCVALYDADRIGGLADSAAVASVADRSGNGNTASQATGANQPTYQTGEIRGRPVVRFDGTTDFLRTAAFATALGQPRTVVAVGAFGGDSQVLCDGIVTGNRHLIWRAAGTIYQLGAGTLISSGAIANTSPHVFVGTANGAASVLRVDGATVASGAAGTNPLTGLTLGASFNTGNFLQGDIALIGLWNRALSSREVRRAERQIARRRYGLAVA